MRWMILVLMFVTIGVPGCGTVQEACPFLTNPQIEALRSAVRADYEAGWTYSSEINIVIDSCAGDFDCITCGTAIVDQIYGR